MKIEGFAAVNIKIAVFWDFTPCCLVEYWVRLGVTTAYTLPQMCLIFQVWLQFLRTGSLLDQGKMEYSSLTSTEMLCYGMSCYVISCVQQFLRLTPMRTREEPNIKGCCNKGFNNLTRNYTFQLFREKFSADQSLFNETEFMCTITSRCEREYNLSLNLLVAMERKTRRIFTMLYP